MYMHTRKYHHIVKLLLLVQLLAACGTVPTTNQAEDTPRATSSSAPVERGTPTVESNRVQANSSMAASLSATPALEPCVAPALPPIASRMMIANVYFTCPDTPPAFTVQRLSRYISASSKTEEQIQAILNQLLAGPTAAEQSAGFFSWFSEATADKLKSVTITNDGIVIVDFADFRSIIPNASTTTGANILLSQLDSTVFQFPNIQAVVYQLDGSCDAFYAWLQSTCQTRTRADWEMRQRTPTN